MERGTLPREIRGSWIWHDEHLSGNDCFLLLRKEFSLDEPGLEAPFWISANSSYELFVNERLIGSGPRPHPDPDCAYVDWHDNIACLLQPGLNVIAVIVRYDAGLCPGRTPGLWCQLEVDRRPVAWSDSNWLLRSGTAFSAPRPRRGMHYNYTDFQNLNLLPRDWLGPAFEQDLSWFRPNSICTPGAGGTSLALHPVLPSWAAEQFFFEPVESGKITDGRFWTEFHFNSFPLSSLRKATFAACTFLYSEEKRNVRVVAYTDDPTRIFCNKKLVLSAPRLFAAEADIPLVQGWNRLLVYQQPNVNSAGIAILFPEHSAGEQILYLDTIAESPEGWSIAGPLRLPMSDVSASLSFERLNSHIFQEGNEGAANAGARLLHAHMRPAHGNGNGVRTMLAEGEYHLYKLDHLRYGYARAEVKASAGDIVDITLGVRQGPGGLPIRGGQRNTTSTLVCAEGLNSFTGFMPDSVAFMLVSVRRARQPVTLLGASFDELVHPHTVRCAFSSSEEWLNDFWRTGAASVRRSAATISQPRADKEHDQFMLDAYMDAVSMTIAYGDCEYAAARLRQFADAQYENGNIPVLSLGGRNTSQMNQTMFFPVWMLFNYRYSGDLEELKRLRPCLDLLREFFEMQLGDDFLLYDASNCPDAVGGLLNVQWSRAGGVPTFLNALFCRFLLSSAEVYSILDEKGKVQHCRRTMRKVAAALRAKNFDEATGLFATSSLRNSEHTGQLLFANFCTLYGGVMPLENFERFFHRFFNLDAPFDRCEEAGDPYFNFLFTDMLFSLQLSGWASDYFAEYWKKHRCPGVAAWSFQKDRSDPTSVRFNGGALHSPVPVMIREIAGIRPAEPGFSAVFLEPELDMASWVDVTLPTVRGRLRIRWEKLADGGLSILIDSAFPVRVIPTLSAEILQQTEFNRSETVTLMKRPEGENNA